MIPKIVWPNSHEKINPFGGKEGFRKLQITFHNQSFAKLPPEENKALEILVGLATLDQIDAMSFDGEKFPKILIESEESADGFIGLQVVDLDQSSILYNHGIHKSWLDEIMIVQLMGLHGLRDEEKISSARQDFLHGKAHNSLRRDIFVTSSKYLVENRRNFEDINVRTPLEALKIISLYLRIRNEDEWVSEVKGNIKYQVSKRIYYQFLARGLLPNSWKYISSFRFHLEYEKLIELGWSVMSRCIRALQARDEIARLFYMPETSRTHLKNSF
jgi:hypothetical protein